MVLEWCFDAQCCSVLLQFWGSLEEARKGVGLDEGPLGAELLQHRDAVEGCG